jgi:hypothetical protein
MRYMLQNPNGAGITEGVATKAQRDLLASQAPLPS